MERVVSNQQKIMGKLVCSLYYWSRFTSVCCLLLDDRNTGVERVGEARCHIREKCHCRLRVTHFCHENVAESIEFTEADGSLSNAYTWIYENLFAVWAGPWLGSLAFAIANVLLWFGFFAILYQRRMFIKV